MAGPLPNVPTNLIAQPGNGQVYLSFTGSVGTSAIVGSSGYNILRSTDGVNFSTLATTPFTNYYDASGTSGVLYYYEVSASNQNGTSNATAPVSATNVSYGQVSLGQVRLAAQQRADMVNSNFVTTQEWNSYISHSYAELYDLLVAVYGDEYFVQMPVQFITDGRYPALYQLPNDFYKLLGVDLSLSASTNGWLTLKKFAFISRNRYIYGNTPVSFLGITNLRYRVLGSQIEFIPQPLGNQTVQIWYIPKPRVLVADSDLLDGISSWDEYIIVDAAIKALQKEESDVTVLMAQKMELKKRIEGMASNRDVGMSEGVTDIRRLDGGYFNDPNGDSPSGGW